MGTTSRTILSSPILSDISCRAFFPSDNHHTFYSSNQNRLQINSDCLALSQSRTRYCSDHMMIACDLAIIDQALDSKRAINDLSGFGWEESQIRNYWRRAIDPITIEIPVTGKDRQFSTESEYSTVLRSVIKAVKQESMWSSSKPMSDPHSWRSSCECKHRSIQ